MILLTKPNSKIRIEIVNDEEDPWFLYVNHVKRASGEIMHSSMIVEKDLRTWLSYLESSGWKQQPQDI
jgi:hypothetical protein